jgi:bifunctional N-acetylglucosamine-1-phosphate-uridyltransferase/glucosamine-1-phosphate-acetyltransferase GlmU-like protein
LSIVWLLETLILFYLSIFKATEVSKEPFSEKNNSWYKFNIYNFNEINTNVILDNISNNNFNFVSYLTKINNLDKNYLEFILYFSNNDDYLLGVNKKTLKIDEK